MKVWAIKCPDCKDLIYSRANHDFRSCTCGGVSVDGGQESYGGRTLWKGGPPPKSVQIEVHGVDKKGLYQDWNYSKGEFGLLKGGVVDLRHQIVPDDAMGSNSDETVRTGSPYERPGSDPGVSEHKPEVKAIKKKRRRRVGSTELPG